ncbi:nitroreductase family protein [Mycoplasma sp. HS2188]|uniref:nitroreductase family protein n=1 Tax=Mycoplasma sp. HS2188 TaxID=2976765 RepID=UPI0021AAC68B|nr:nitroreductase family protein [Mycoplasma sp. HS2188]MCT4469522.1 nitroreductase family protein [Mycoplasma sp. HS2188]
MNFYQKIMDRYSVREFDTNNPITDDEYKKIIDAVNSAPTSSNWHSSSVIVVKDREILTELSKANKFTGALKTADILLVFLADFNRMNEAKKEFPEYEYNSNSTESYTVAVGDAFIQATMAQDMALSLGLDTLFLGLTRMMVEPLITNLNIQGQAFPVVSLAIGHKASEGKIKPKLNRVFENKYDIDRLKHDVAEYNDQILDYFKLIAPDKAAYSYTHATIKSASSYKMNTDIIEKIWDLKLIKK